MHYIRFLKPPKLYHDASKGPSVRLVLAIVTDLGDDFFHSDFRLVVEIKPASSAAPILACHNVVWRRDSRALPVVVELGASYGGAPFVVSVHCQDPSYENFQVRDGALVMPCIVPVQSSLVEPIKGRIEADKLAVRTFAFVSGTPPVVIREDTGESIARHIWDAGAALSYFIDRSFWYPPTALPGLDRCLAKAHGSGLDVIELGTGCGLVGITLAAVVSNANVLLTDVEDAATVNIQSSDASRVSYCRLDWCSVLPEVVLNRQFDLIVAADCTYNADSSPALVRTICRLHDESKGSLVLIASKTRHASEAVFFELMEMKMFVQESKFSVLAPGVYMEGVSRGGEVIDIYTFTKE